MAAYGELSMATVRGWASAGSTSAYVPRRQYDEAVKDVKPIYIATDVALRRRRFSGSARKWGGAAAPSGRGVAWELGVRDPVHGLPA
jgi:hypothetical protein